MQTRTEAENNCIKRCKLIEIKLFAANIIIYGRFNFNYLISRVFFIFQCVSDRLFADI